jgi:hypothetical protein
MHACRQNDAGNDIGALVAAPFDCRGDSGSGGLGGRLPSLGHQFLHFHLQLCIRKHSDSAATMR